MGTIWVKEFTGGLDTRRMAEATSGTVLTMANNGHITRGGEFEKRAAFVPTYALPAGTIGMAAGKNTVTVFGSGTTPAGLPAGIAYQRLQHPDGVTALVKVPSYTLYAGLIYAVAQFADGSVYHYYDGARVTDWYDGRARAQLTLTSATTVPATNATGSFEITGGASGDTITAVFVAGVNILGAAVTHTGNNATTADAVAAQITSNVSSPDYTAVSSGQLVRVTAVAGGTAANGKAITTTVTGAFTTGNFIAFSGGAAAIPAVINDITVNGVGTMNAPVTYSTSLEAMATAIASSINAKTSTPEYTAVASGANVVLVSSTIGAAVNGYAVAVSSSGNVTYSPTTGLVMAGGNSVTAVAASGSFTVTGGTTAGTLSALTVNSVPIISSAVTHTGNNATTATAIASAINSYSSSPDYTASANGAVVTITAVSTGSAYNGFVIAPTVTGTFTVGSITPLSGGVDAVYQPGSFVRTVGSKIYSTSDSNLHFSGIAQPTKWTTETTGAGFIDMSSQATGSEILTAVAKYQKLLAIFAEKTIQIWSVDSDPNNNTQSQVLENTGTISPRSVVQFGDNDLFYLDESGVRSLRARDSSNAAASNDIGVLIDTLVTQKLADISYDDRNNIIALIEPRDGRYWLAMIDQIFVFSYYPGSQISAWTTYTPSYIDDQGEDTQFTVDELCLFQRRVYARSGNTIFVYGGLSSARQYDKTVAEAWLPYMDANKPTEAKTFTGFDAAVEGEWEVAVAMQPTASEVEDPLAKINETTFTGGSQPGIGDATHISLRFRSTNGGYARIASTVIHYEGSGNED